MYLFMNLDINGSAVRHPCPCCCLAHYSCLWLQAEMNSLCMLSFHRKWLNPLLFFPFSLPPYPPVLSLSPSLPSLSPLCHFSFFSQSFHLSTTVWLELPSHSCSLSQGQQQQLHCIESLPHLLQPTTRSFVHLQKNFSLPLPHFLSKWDICLL